MKKRQRILFLFCLGWLGIFPVFLEADPRCPLADIPSPPVVPADTAALLTTLRQLTDQRGQTLLRFSGKEEAELREIFSTTRQNSKIGQFFALLFWMQRLIPEERLPVVVRPPGITNVLLAARVFKTDDFPKKIRATTLARDDRVRPPLVKVDFSESEVRFPINEGVGFATWDQGKCQIMKELVFYNGFSFRLRRARNSRNLVVDDFHQVELFGDFGTRKTFSIDLQYVALQKVEFIAGTNEGKVTARVAQREFRENKHSKIFQFIGTLIPNTSRQPIDW